MGERCSLPKPIPPLVFFCESSLNIEKARVAAEVRKSHLVLQGRTDPETEEILKLLKPVEEYVDSRLKVWVLEHPTAHWWKRISGCITTKGNALEPVGKVIGLIDAFGRYYPENDPEIPFYVQREPVIDEEGKKWIWVEAIERLVTPSKLWKYAGLTPGSKREFGKKLDFNSNLRMTLFRLMKYGFLMNADKCQYYQKYDSYKNWKKSQLEKDGIKIRPTPKGRFCPNCAAEKNVKSSTLWCPDCGEKLGKKDEPTGIIWEGHLDFMCRRWCVKLWLSHFWVIYRQALGLPIRQPYPIEKMSHTTVIDPWEMCDL